ncbi:MAG: hypothetical protein WCT45_01230 [Candidatus Paceibacterota bacterium]|jgi:hypothetical protein
MKHFLATSFFFIALLVGATGAAPVAHAAGTKAVGAYCEGSAECASGFCKADAGGSGGGTCQPLASASTDEKANAGAATDAAKAAEKSATDNKISDDDKYGFIMTKIMSLFAWLVGVAAITLDNAVYYTVVTMGTYVNNLSAVGVAWTVLRDLGNILLIFGFLAIGITTILNVDWYGGGKKMLPKLVLAAVFLNFSLFMTEAVIDVGNLFATQFYTQINGGQAAGVKGFSTSSEGISNKIMDQLGLQTIYGDAQRKPDLLKGANSWFVGFMGILLFIVTAFVLFSLAFILIARFVILLYLIILAPVGFAGFAIPQLEGAAKSWRDALVEQTLTAPVLLLTLYVALAVITDVNFLTGPKQDWTGFINGDFNGFAGMLLSFLVAMGLLLAVTIFAKKLSAFGASGATKLAGGVTGALSFGAMSLAGRGTAGVAGYALNAKRIQARAAGGGLLGAAARVSAFAGRNLEGRTFDVRNVPGAKLLGGAAGLVPGAGLGSAFAGGATVTAKGAIDKSRELGSKYYGPSPLQPFTGDWWRDQKKEYEKAAAELERKKNIAKPGTEDFTKTIKKMSADELAELRGIRKGTEEFVAALSPSKYSELQKSDKLLASEKKHLKDVWNGQFEGDKASATIARFSTEEVAALDGETLTKPDVINALGANELDAIMRKGSLNKVQRDTIFSSLNSAPAGSTAKAALDDYLSAANDPGGRRSKYWNTSGAPAAGGAGAGVVGGVGAPPPGFQQNPGGAILTPNNPGRGPRP